jgi:hypothetical protein
MRSALGRIFTGSIALLLLAVCLMVVLSYSNEELRDKVSDRQQIINQGLQLSQTYNRMVMSLAIVAARDNDERLQALLSQRGVSFALLPERATTPGAAGPESAEAP